jgi:hypothetical protein
MAHPSQAIANAMTFQTIHQTALPATSQFRIPGEICGLKGTLVPIFPHILNNPHIGSPGLVKVTMLVFVIREF